jgi:hypothetical protein
VQVSRLIEKEAKECIEKQSIKKKSFNPGADEIIPMWSYVIINADIPNILTECCLLQDFRLKITQPETEYILTTFQSAVEQFKKDISHSNTKYTTITPIYIQTKTIIPDISSDSFASRSQSMSTVNSKMTNKDPKDKEDGIIGSVTSSIKGLFK